MDKLTILRKNELYALRCMDEKAVERLAEAMNKKMEFTRETLCRTGWWWNNEETRNNLHRMIWDCMRKGDPVDVANLCAFIQDRGETIGPDPYMSMVEAERDDALAMVKRIKEIVDCNSNHVLSADEGNHMVKIIKEWTDAFQPI